MDWSQKKVLVTGGASFIGSHLVDKLLTLGVRNLRIVDNLSSGRLDNIQNHLENGRVEFWEDDLLKPGVAHDCMHDIDVVFHLAADHGGRGYVEIHSANCAANFMMDGLVFTAAKEAAVEKVVFASSGCIYPNYIQTDPNEILYLTEGLAGPPYDSDDIYGWAKLMGEFTLKAFYKEGWLKTASCRYFTVYGERGIENHAVMAMIARAFVKQNPFAVWGTGEQIRNWTYISDIVDGTILAAEKIDDGTAVNLGTMERIKVIDAVQEVLRYSGHQADIELHPEMPTGPYNRVADNGLAKKLLGWSPKVSFKEGLHRTMDWYFREKDVAEGKKNLPAMLTGRMADGTAASVKSEHAIRSSSPHHAVLRSGLHGDRAHHARLGGRSQTLGVEDIRARRKVSVRRKGS